LLARIIIGIFNVGSGYPKFVARTLNVGRIPSLVLILAEFRCWYIHIVPQGFQYLGCDGLMLLQFELRRFM